MTVLRFSIPGEPQGKGRARAARTKMGVRMFTPEKTRSYEAIVRSISAEAMGTMTPIEGPVAMHLRAYFQAPKNLKKSYREAVDRETLPVTKRPDVDNIAKSLADGMNGIVYKDDAQVFSATAEKFYSDRPRVEVEISYDGGW